MAENCGCKYDTMERVPQEPVDMTATLRKLSQGSVDMAGGMLPEEDLAAGGRRRSSKPTVSSTPVNLKRSPSRLVVPDEFWAAMNPKAATTGWLRNYSQRWAAAWGPPPLGTSVDVAAGFPEMGTRAHPVGGPVGLATAQRMGSATHFKAVGQSGCCEPLPIKTRAIDIANLAKVCRIDLGECRMYD
ncbi:MAG TPA: hypothetical protein PKY30_20385, partial [Myxococcota bacterium]|nr:hypothetical protein [Myxococcota bacterium]